MTTGIEDTTCGQGNEAYSLPSTLMRSLASRRRHWVSYEESSTSNLCVICSMASVMHIKYLIECVCVCIFVCMCMRACMCVWLCVIKV